MQENEKEKANEVSDGEAKLSDALFSLEQANRWIESADTKTGAGLTLISITFSIYAGFLLTRGLNNFPDNIKPWITGFSITSFVLFSLAMFLFIWVLKPRLTKPADRKNPFYYGEVNRYERAELFVEQFKTPLDENAHRKCLLESAYFTSQIAWKKMRLFRIGLIISGLFFVASIITIVLALFF